MPIPVESTNYPDTTRVVGIGAEAVERTPAANLHFLHTMNEPAHTLQNGVIFLEENTGTRTRDSGAGRGKRSSTIRLQAYVRVDELGLLCESAIAQGATVNFPNTSVQILTMNGVPTGGTFTLTWEGQTTTPLAYNITGAAMQTALEALSNIAPGDVTVAGSAGGPWTATFPAGVPGAPGIIAPGFFIPDPALLAGGTSPHIVVTESGTVASAYLRTYIGGSARGLPITIVFFNGLYWRRMSGARVNTMNVQGSGTAMAMVDVEIIGPASTKISAPSTFPSEDRTYKAVDVPMQSFYLDGVNDAEVDRMAFNINNNLTMRNTMDGTTSSRRTRIGFFGVEIDGMVDYKQYAGSFYQAMETDGGATLGAADLVMVDDLQTVGTGTPINPFAIFHLPSPLLADTTEGDDGGELVQMVKGRAEPDTVENATLIVYIATGRATSFYDPS